MDFNIHTYQHFGILFLFFIVLISSCKKPPPPWIEGKTYISQELVRKGYAVSSVSIYPSKVLSQIRCEVENQKKMEIVVRGEIEPEIKKRLKIGDKQAERKFQDMMVKIARKTVDKLKDRIQLEEVFADEKNGILYCKNSLEFDEEFYSVLLDVTQEVIKESEFEILFPKEEYMKEVLEVIEAQRAKVRRK